MEWKLTYAHKQEHLKKRLRDKYGNMMDWMEEHKLKKTGNKIVMVKLNAEYIYEHGAYPYRIDVYGEIQKEAYNLISKLPKKYGKVRFAYVSSFSTTYTTENIEQAFEFIQTLKL